MKILYLTTILFLLFNLTSCETIKQETLTEEEIVDSFKYLDKIKGQPILN